MALLCAALACVAALLSLPSVALGARGHVFKESFGEPCIALPCEGGELKEPAGLAVNESTGDVYVVDKGNNRVQRFNGATGAFLGEFDGSGSFEPEPGVVKTGEPAPSQPLLGPTEIAVDDACFQHQPKLIGTACEAFDPSNGDVYVVDAGHKVIDKFTTTGEYLGQVTGTPAGSFSKLYGLAVGGTGELWVSDEIPVPQHEGVDNFTNAAVNKFESFRPTVAAGFLSPGLAVDSEDNLYVHNNNFGLEEDIVAKYDSAGHLLLRPRELHSPTGLAVEPTTDDLYIDHGASFDRLDPEGNPLETLQVPGASPAGTGIAADASTGTVYLADAAGLIDVYGLEPPGPPTVSAESTSASGVSAEAATLRAQLNPHGAETTYRFEYGPCDTPLTCASSPYGHSAPVPEALLAAGFDLSPVSVRLQGLQPGTPYHFRLFAENSHGNVTGEELSFTTQSLGGALMLPDARQWELVSPPEKRGALIGSIENGGTVFQASASGGAFTYLASAATEALPQGNAERSQLLSTRSPSGWQTRDIALPHTGPSGHATGLGQEYRFFSEDLAFGVVQPFGAFTPQISPQASEQTPFLRTDFLAAGLTEQCATACFRPLVTGTAGFANVPSGTAFGEEGQCPPTLFCGPIFQGTSPDASHVVISSQVGLTEGEGSGGGLYEWSAGALTFIGQGSLGHTGTSARGAISTNGSRVFFEGVSEGHEGLLMRDVPAAKTLKLDLPEAGCGTCGSGGGHFQIASANGSRVFFTSDQRLTAAAGAEPDEPDLYVCEVVEEAGSPACLLTDLTPMGAGEEPAGVRGGVLGASEDGSSVYFVANGIQGTSPGTVHGECDALGKPNAVCNLYVIHREGSSWGKPALVAVLSQADNFDWRLELPSQPTRVSPDGEWLAFMSTRSLTGLDNRDAQSGERDWEAYLYRASSGELECASCGASGAQPAGGKQENTESIRPPGLEAGALPGWTPYQLGSARYQPRYLSDSGRLFFNAFPRLVPADVNDVLDVYQFEPDSVGDCGPATANPAVIYKHLRPFAVEGRPGSEPAGCVGLVSSGTSNVESEFLDASESGDDVFFRTSTQLSPTDVDTAPDVYDARVGGGFPQPASPPICQGDACQQPAAPPSHPTPGTLLVNGPENVKECPTGKVKKGAKCVAKHKAKKNNNKHKKNAHKKKGGGKKQKRANSNRGGQK